MIRLTALIDTEGQGKKALTHESNATQIVIGRDRNADFQLPLTTVSRRHAQILETDGVYVVEDLGSTHGTLVNGAQLKKGDRQVLKTGTIIQFTQAKVTCQIESEKVVDAQPGEGTQAIAAKAVEGILGRLGDSEQEELPYLRVLTGPEEGKRYLLEPQQNEWRIGRSKECECVVADPNISRQHAIVRKDWKGFTVQDLGSKNGVLVNEHSASKPRRLKDKDQISLGPVKFVFVDPDADLLEALQDVPGFEEHASVQEAEAEAEAANALSQEELGEIPEPDASEAEAALTPERPTYANIDPDLLEENASGSMEWAIAGLAVLFLLGCLGLLAAILS